MYKNVRQAYEAVKCKPAATLMPHAVEAVSREPPGGFGGEAEERRSWISQTM